MGGLKRAIIINVDPKLAPNPAPSTSAAYHAENST